jgi:serine/threonine-protein kinase
MTPVKAGRTWKARHWAIILAAPLLVATGGVVAYAKLSEHAPSVAVPDVVDTDVFAAAATLKDAGFEISAVAADSPRPGGTILAQNPTNGNQAEEGSTIKLTVSKVRAIVPVVAGMTLDEAKAALARRGLLNVVAVPDYRDDVDAGTVMSTNPGAFLKATKSDPLQVVVATDPHVKVRNVVGLDQATATAQLRADGLEVAVQTATSKSAPVGQVLKTSPGADTTVSRGDTITLTVSSGRKLVAVPPLVGTSRDDAVGELEDRGFAVVVDTVTATTGDQVDTVLAQDPAGGQAAEGSTVTVTVGVKKGRG